VLKNHVFHHHLAPSYEGLLKGGKIMGAIAKAAVIKNRRDKKEEKKD
jgi:hypothetical protein